MASDIKPNLPVDEVFSAISKATDEWRKENTDEKIREKVFTKLDAKREEVVAKMMGFDNKWGRWELDHCNGRAGQSFIGNLMTEYTETNLRSWFNESVKEIDLSKELTKILINEARKQYKEYFKYALQNAVRDQAIKDANRIIEEIGTSQVLNVMNELQKTTKR